MTTGRRFCFTYFITDEDDLFQLDPRIQTIRQGLHFRGMCYQLERCPTTSREHLQGYIEYNKPRKFNSILQELPPGTHLELARGNRSSCVDYCSKSDTRVEGPWCDDVLKNTKGQGHRTDLFDIGKSIMSGEVDEITLATERPDVLIKYPRGIRELYAISALKHKSNLRTTMRVEVIWGPAGTGKTRQAMADLDNSFLLDASNSDTLWFDGYQGEKVLVVDDFYGWIRHGTLLRLLDIYPYRCPLKGSHTYAGWTTIYLTSNKHPSTWYDKFPWQEDGALKRRIHRIWEVVPTMFGFTWTCEKTKEFKQFNNDFIEIN